MDADIETLEEIYSCFNARDLDGVLAKLTHDVVWANAMDGGHVHGHEGVRAYWLRQWAIVSPHVEPVGYRRDADGAIVAEVIQTIRDLQGRPLQDPAEGRGLKDKTVAHVFRLEGGKVARFDVQDVA